MLCFLYGPGEPGRYPALLKIAAKNMNQISDRMQTGVIGEHLVQIRLLQHDIQAAPPISDSGNDLIAVNGDQFRAIQVRTTTTGAYKKPKPNRQYHILAVVDLNGEDRDVNLDQSSVFFIPREAVDGAPTSCHSLIEDYSISEHHLGQLFGPLVQDG